MSYFVMDYGNTWAEYREQVKAARDTYLQNMEQLSKYADSAQGQKDAEACEAAYKAALEAARDIARPKFNNAVEGMKNNISKPGMQPPTAEMLATLQLLELRDDIEAGEAEAAAKLMGNNDAALKALRDVLMRKGRPLPSSVKTFEAQTRDAVDALARAAGALLQWDGREGVQIMHDYLAQRNAYRFGDGEQPTHNALVARHVADVEAQAFYKDTVRAVIGGDVSTDVIDALDK